MATDKKYGKLSFFKPSPETGFELPLVEASVSAGFPSPADDYLEERLDLNKALIGNPGATFYARVKGESMSLAGISDGDLLVIDKSKTPVNGSVVVCMIDGEFTVKRLEKNGKDYFLMPENADFQPIKIKPENSVTIWGVVTYTIKKHF
ncbi:MAG: LexA family protein [Prolixibacteraceae bacterium]